jgi:hypothetical protein
MSKLEFICLGGRPPNIVTHWPRQAAAQASGYPAEAKGKRE